jgi:hypothetical protein
MINLSAHNFFSIQTLFMKKFLVAAVAVCIFFSCNKTSTVDDLVNPGEELTASQRKCAAHEVQEEQMRNDPALRARYQEVENFVQRFLETPGNETLLPNGTIEIPVVVNVLYKTNAQNISQEQIDSQIDVLNDDFSATNSDYSSVPSVFQSVKSGDFDIKFVLAGVNRRQTNKSSWQLNDQMKKAQAGIPPTDPATTLNMWVCNLAGGYLGYAQFPGGPLATDGVVIDDNAMGTTGTAEAPFDLGRTATHEVGHWINLRHIWGDATCGSDLVNDTPPHRTYNFGCPGVINITCTNNSTTNPFGFNREMTMNYMDYTDDACMFMFSLGQKARGLAVFASGGPRNSFAQP